MRLATAIGLGFVAIGQAAFAQGGPETSSVTPEQREAVSDERAAKVRSQVADGRKRQEAIDRQNTDLWTRWTFAVCMGCSPMPKNQRVVHTYPHRVLIGIPAAMDDARERRGQRI